MILSYLTPWTPVHSNRWFPSRLWLHPLCPSMPLLFQCLSTHLNACQCLYLSSQSLSVPLLSMRPTYGEPAPFPFAVPAPRWLHHSLAVSRRLAGARQRVGTFDLTNMKPSVDSALWCSGLHETPFLYVVPVSMPIMTQSEGFN